MQIWYALAIAAGTTVSTPAPTPFPVQFAHSLAGREVTVCIDGQVEKTFAGKMGFREANRSWTSVCADVRSPVHQGQIYYVQAYDSAKVGGGYAKAGTIVAKYFRAAQTPDQCAGLQIAVWEAIEDGGETPLFVHFQVQASPAVLAYAQQFYQAAQGPTQTSALLAAAGAGGGGGQSQLSPSDSV